MPRVTTIYIHRHRNSPEPGSADLKLAVSVNSKGVFFCALPEGMELALKNIFKGMEYTHNGTVKVFANTLESLEAKVQEAFKIFTKPEVKEEAVIRYNIESRVSFVTDEAGNIFPNGYYLDDKFSGGRPEEMYGGINSINLARRGYSLTVGAMAMLKTTYSYGDQDKVSYGMYYKGGSHLGTENPAERLNSWRCITLPDDCKEMPYSDEAAEFFFNLMHGMARMAQTIQNHTFDEEKLLALIHSGNLLMPGNAPEGDNE